MEKKKKFGRGEASKAIEEYIRKNPGVSKGKLEDEFDRNTVWYNIYSPNAKLKEKLKIDKKLGPKGNKIDTYYVIEKREESDKPNPDYLKFLMATFLETEKQNTPRKAMVNLIFIINDMEQVCYFKKVRDRQFISFILEKAKDEFYLDFSPPFRVWNCLSIICQSLFTEWKETKDPEIEKLFYHISSTMTPLLKKIIFDKKRYIEIRISAFETLVSTGNTEFIPIVFELLPQLDTKRKYQYSKMEKKYDTDFNFFIPRIREIIMKLAEKDENGWLYVRQNLFDLLDLKLNKIIRREVLNLWSKTSLRYKCTNNNVMPQDIEEFSVVDSQSSDISK